MNRRPTRSHLKHTPIPPIVVPAADNSISAIGLNIDWTIARKIAPYFIYQQIVFNSFRGFFTQRIDSGFNFFLRRVWIKTMGVFSDNFPPLKNGPVLIPELYIEFFDKGNFKARQANPIPIPLLSTPGNSDVWNSGGPFTDGHYNSTARMPLYSKFLNFLYVYGDVIDIEITGQQGTQLPGPTGYQPWFADVMLEGYYIPEESLTMWKGM